MQLTIMNQAITNIEYPSVISIHPHFSTTTSSLQCIAVLRVSMSPRMKDKRHA